MLKLLNPMQSLERHVDILVVPKLTKIYVDRIAWNNSFFKNGPTPASFFVFSTYSNKHYNFYNKSMWKNVHPVNDAGIQIHDLSNMNCHP